MRQPDNNKHQFAWWLAGLAALIFLGIAWSSFRRHLHVDEFNILYSIKLCGAYGHPDYMVPADLYEIVLAPLARHLPSSVAFVVAFRWLFLAGLFALCAGIALVQRVLPTPEGKASAFLCAVLFGPLFRHGFEVRHDLFQALAAVLLYWACERANHGSLTFRVATVAAALAALVQANSFKALAVCAPALGLCALLSARGHDQPVRRFVATLLRFIPGFLGGVLIAAVIVAGSRAFGAFVSQIRYYTNFSLHSSYRLSPFPLVHYMAVYSPVHAALVLLGLYGVVARIVAREPLAEILVPACFFLLTLIAASLNPALFPYNLTWIAPSLIWMSLVGFSEIQRRISSPPIRKCVNTALLLFGLVCATRAHLDPYFRKTWNDQMRVIRAAEILTHANDPVLDLTGLVVSRPPPARDWLVHGLLMPDYHASKRESVAHIIKRVWPPVIVGGHYRWGFLDEIDRRTVAQYYLRLTYEIWALGSSIHADTRRVEIHRAGRYLVQADVANGQVGTLDAQRVDAGQVLALAAGIHSVQTERGPWQLVWLGPAPALPSAPTSAPLFERLDLPGQL